MVMHSHCTYHNSLQIELDPIIGWGHNAPSTDILNIMLAMRAYIGLRACKRFYKLDSPACGGKASREIIATRNEFIYSAFVLLEEIIII